MDELNYVITKAKEQIAKLEKLEEGEWGSALLLQYLKVIRDAVYTKAQVGEEK